MTADAVLPLVTAEWRTTTDIARALDAEGRRGSWPSAQRRAWRSLRNLEASGRVEHARGDGNSYVWRLAP
jgi:hypothetical protein